MKARFGFAFAGVAALALAACQQSNEASQPPEPVTEDQIAAQTPNAPSDRPINLIADGLVIAAPEAGGDATILNFGDKQEIVVEELTMIFGGPQFGTNEECGAGPMEYANYDKFVAHFQDDRFVGWMVNGPRDRANFTGPDGVKLGMSAADLRKLPTFEALTDSTLGEEFMIGDGQLAISGLIEDNQVSVLWGGETCNFR